MVINIFKKKTEDVKSEKNLVLICALFVYATKHIDRERCTLSQIHEVLMLECNSKKLLVIPKMCRE